MSKANASMRTLYNQGQGVRLPNNQWLYKGVVYNVPKGKGNIFARAKSGGGFNGQILRASAKQLMNMMRNGHVPSPSLRVG